MPMNDSNHHVVKTTAQWEDRAVQYWVVPRGCLCIELTPDKKTKIKIGEGNKYYSQLPYIHDESELENYYTKTEIDNLFNNLEYMSIKSTEEYDDKSELPLTGNDLGDVRFVKSQSPSIKTDPDVYLWNGSKWIFVGTEFPDIDLSEYLKKEEFHEIIDPLIEKVDEIYPKAHTHENMDVLNDIEEPYTTAEKEKLAGLENYDDTEIRELIEETSHTHPNKAILDSITEDSILSESDREKFDSLHNYDDTDIKERISELEEDSHTHDNKEILDQTTASFTVEDKEKLDSLENPETFVGTDGVYPGLKGLVPAPAITDVGKFLSSDGTWEDIGDVSVEIFTGATETTDGTSGTVPAPLAGDQDKFLKGDGTWAEVEGGGGPYVTEITNHETLPGAITYSKSDDTTEDVDVLANLRMILNCNNDNIVPPTPTITLGVPVESPLFLDKYGESIIGDITTETPDEPPNQTMEITGFVNGAGTSGQGSYSTRIITQGYYDFPAANILTLSGTKPSGKSLWFEYDYYTSGGTSVGYWQGLTESSQVNMSSVQGWWPNYQISKFKLVVGFSDNSPISPSDVTIQLNYNGY